jgi:biotin carboxylase
MVVVDPMSTGAVVVADIVSRGHRVVRVYSDDFPDNIINMVLEGVEVEYVGTVKYTPGDDVTATVNHLRRLGFSYIGVLAGCETGVELADAVSEALGLRTNGIALSDARRNKFRMGEQVRASGVRSAQQVRATTWKEIEARLGEFGVDGDGQHQLKVVIKPVASAGSDDVYLCRSVAEVEANFQRIIGTRNVFGVVNAEVVVQEYLEGDEYVVDTVSMDGVHKCVAVWKYDKRAFNGAPFVYFGLELMGVENGCEVDALIDYQFSVLDALGIQNGPAHGEVKLTPTGPCLVEVGARCHGGEGAWVSLVHACLGYTQTSVCVDVVLDPQRFYELPARPRLTKTFGYEVELVSPYTGLLQGWGRLDELMKLESFFELDLFARVGELLVKTIDCMTTPGSVRLLNTDKQQLTADILRVREIEKSPGFYTLA